MHLIVSASNSLELLALLTKIFLAGALETILYNVYLEQFSQKLDE